MSDRCRTEPSRMCPPTRHIRVGPDFSHAATSVAPGRVHPLVRSDAAEEGCGRGVTLVNFFPLVKRVEP